MTFLTVPDAACRQYRQWTLSGNAHTNVASCCCTRVDSDDNTPLESERERRGTVLDLDPAAGVGVIVGVEAEEGGRLIGL